MKGLRWSSLLRPEARWWLLALIAAPISAGLVVLQPVLLRAAVDDAIVAGDGSLLVRCALGFLAATVGGFVAESIYQLALGVGSGRAIRRLREVVFSHALALAPSFHDHEPTGRLLSRITSDIEALGETLTAGAVTIVLDAMVILGMLVMMFWMDPWLSAVLLLVAPPLMLITELVRRRLRVLFLEVRSSLAELMAFAAERIAGIEVVQLTADERRSLERFDEKLAPYRRSTVATNVWDSLLFAIVDGVTSITMAMMLWYGSSPWFDHLATPGLLAAFVDAVGKLFNPIRELSSKVAVLQRAGSAVDKIGALLARDDVLPEGDQTLPAEAGDLRLHDVGFAYGAGPPVLHGVTFTIHPGEVVAVVGRTGSGKSTLARLLSRTYTGYTGSITVDGVELARLTHAALRSRVSIVQQDTLLFPGDVRFNLTLGDPISDERLLSAVSQAQASSVLERLGGLGGRIEHSGRNLSVGEGQLLAFARVLARDARFVVLDEATASVDSLTESRIQVATETLLRERTVLVIAHRLSTIAAADRIIVMADGAPIEIGTHADLLARGGAYAAMFRSQFAVEPSAVA